MIICNAMAAHDKDTELDEGIGGIVDEIASSWIVGDALTRLVDTGEKVVRAQQSALSALGLPSGSQFESLTLRVRTLFHRIEELEDDIDRLDARVAKLESAAKPAARPAAAPRRATTKKSSAKKPASKRSSS
jgi:ubiquinone biosynthesis protein UbiJ